jgi:ketosteroid isomerase-like protein
MSDADQNKATALRFITTMRDYAGGDERLLTDDHKWFLPNQKVCTVREIKAHIAMRAKESMPVIPTMTVIGVAADGDRVAVEAAGKCDLTNGKRYDNFYHFVLEFRDGRICTMKEYCDTKLVIDTFGAVPALWL